MPWQPEARHETKRWELERQTRDKTKNMNMFALFVSSSFPGPFPDQGPGNEDVFVFDLFYVRQEKRQKILLPFWNSLILFNVCVIIGTRRIGHSITRRFNNIPWQDLDKRKWMELESRLFHFVFLSFFTYRSYTSQYHTSWKFYGSLITINE